MEETPSFCNDRKYRRQHIDRCSLIQNSISINPQVSAQTLKSYSGIGKNKGGAEREFGIEFGPGSKHDGLLQRNTAPINITFLRHFHCPKDMWAAGGERRQCALAKWRRSEGLRKTHSSRVWSRCPLDGETLWMGGQVYFVHTH